MISLLIHAVPHAIKSVFTTRTLGADRTMMKIHISYRNAKGQMQSVDPLNMPENVDVPLEVAVAAQAIVKAMTKGRRGRPKGYRCDAETRRRMREGQQARWRRIKAEDFGEHVADLWSDVPAEDMMPA